MESATSRLGTVGVVKRAVDSAESARANKLWWDADAADYLATHGDFLQDVEFMWCPEGLTESDANLLGDVGGKRVLEVGCGSAPCARWLATRCRRAPAPTSRSGGTSATSSR